MSVSLSFCRAVVNDCSLIATAVKNFSNSRLRARHVVTNPLGLAAHAVNARHNCQGPRCKTFLGAAEPVAMLKRNKVTP